MSKRFHKSSTHLHVPCTHAERSCTHLSSFCTHPPRLCTHRTFPTVALHARTHVRAACHALFTVPLTLHWSLFVSCLPPILRYRLPLFIPYSDHSRYRLHEPTFVMLYESLVQSVLVSTHDIVLSQVRHWLAFSSSIHPLSVDGKFQRRFSPVGWVLNVFLNSTSHPSAWQSPVRQCLLPLCIWSSTKTSVRKVSSKDHRMDS